MNCSVVYSVVSLEILAPYTIRIHFEDGATRTVDFSKVLGGELFRPLRDLNYFNQVFISEGIPTLSWPNGADFNPDHLYDWPNYKEQYVERVARWEQQESPVMS